MIKDREALAAIDPFAKTMLLTTLHWPDEIRALGELDLPAEEPEIKPAEQKMAEQLIEAMTGEFDPTAYQDEYREALLKIIEAKVAGEETVAAPEAEPATNLVDLMAALEASVKAAVDARGKGAPTPVGAAKSKATAKAAAEADDEAEEARPARRRKSA